MRGEPRRVRAPADRAAQLRGVAGTRPRSSCSAARSGRRSCSRRSACSSWPTARPTSPGAGGGRRGRPDGLLEPGLCPAGDSARPRWATAPRWFQLYWGTRTSSSTSFVAPRRGRRVRGDRASPLDTTHARLAPARPRPRLPPVPPRDGPRAVHERPGVPTRCSTPTPDPAAARPRPRRGGEALVELSRAAIPAAPWRTCARGRPAPRVRLFLDIFSRPSLGWDESRRCAA